MPDSRYVDEQRIKSSKAFIIPCAGANKNKAVIVSRNVEEMDKLRSEMPMSIKTDLSEDVLTTHVDIKPLMRNVKSDSRGRCMTFTCETPQIRYVSEKWDAISKSHKSVTVKTDWKSKQLRQRLVSVAESEGCHITLGAHPRSRGALDDCCISGPSDIVDKYDKIVSTPKFYKNITLTDYHWTCISSTWPKPGRDGGQIVEIFESALPPSIPKPKTSVILIRIHSEILIHGWLQDEVDRIEVRW